MYYTSQWQTQSQAQSQTQSQAQSQTQSQTDTDGQSHIHSTDTLTRGDSQPVNWLLTECVSHWVSEVSHSRLTHRPND